MTPDEWRRVGELFEAALELPPARRHVFLESACPEDAGLRAEVEALLDADSTPHTLLERGAAALLCEPAEDLGTRIGPYRVAGVLGAGGMGAVYLGERDDGQFEQRVALKVLRPGAASDDLRRRFQEERRILARLVHPGIARLYDGGVLADGRPWLAMELVEGEPLDRHARGLPLPARLRLFQDVCAAVHHAHGRLIVHRDLKPDNILVTAGGTVKLLDFGIAKMLEEPGGLTRTGVHAMTPGYAAPEQVRGEPITTATDVYGLGLILFELCAGRRPFEIGGRSMAELGRIICDVAPPRPSSLAPEVSRDLDAICARALRKEPEQRYASVDHLREDVARFLRDEPVLARRGTWRYKARKFLRRHAAAVATTAAVTLGFAALIMLYTARLSRARDRADHAAAKAAEVAHFLTDLFASADPDQTRGERLTARELLEEGRRRIGRESLAPEVKVDLLAVMADAHASLGLYGEASALYEESLRLERSLPSARDLEVARLQHALGDIRREQARFDEAEKLMRAALAIRRRELPADHPDIAESLDGLGALAQDRGRWKEAEVDYEQALAMRRRLDPRSRSVADSLANLAVLDRDRGDYDGAIARYREALALHRAVLGDQAPATVTDRFELGDALRKRGDYAQAEPLYRAALAAREKLFGENHPDTANSLNHLARLLYQEHRYDEAEPLFRRALAANRRLYGNHHAAVAASLGGLAGLLLARGDAAAAEPLYQEARKILERIYGHEHPYTVAVMKSLASVAWARGRKQEAIARYREVLALARKVLPPGHVDLARTLVGLGVALRDTGDAAGAEPFLAEAYAIRAAALPANHPDVVRAAIEWGACLVALGRYADAQPLLLGARASAARDPRLTDQADRGLLALYRAWGRKIAAAGGVRPGTPARARPPPRRRPAPRGRNDPPPAR